MFNKREVDNLAREIRRFSILSTTAAKSSHLGGALSIADVVAYLYLNFNLPTRGGKIECDTFILSKGHCCIALYAAIAVINNTSNELLASFGADGSTYMTHCSSHSDGIPFSTGSLGHGLPVAVGIALSRKVGKRRGKTIVLMSDGELQEGTTWESLCFASKHKLSNLIIMVDANGLQGLGPIEDVVDRVNQWRAISAIVPNYFEIDGHDMEQLDKILTMSLEDGPLLIMLKTIKGKGVSFIEGNNLYHYKPLTDNESRQAIEGLAKQ